MVTILAHYWGVVEALVVAIRMARGASDVVETSADELFIGVPVAKAASISSGPVLVVVLVVAAAPTT